MERNYLGTWYINHYAYKEDCSFLNDDNFVPEGFLKMDKPELVQHTLRRYGILQQPIYGKNVEEERWVEECDWIYYTEFWPQKLAENVWLCLEGLDTVCDIVLNGHCIGHGNNMHIPYQFDVSSLLKYGKCNRLYIRFYSPSKWVENCSREGLFSTTDYNRLFLRKAQMSYGWDFTGRCVTMGLWKDVYLEYRDHAKIKDFYLYTKELDQEENRAELGLTVWTDAVKWNNTGSPAICCRILYEGQTVYDSETAEGEEESITIKEPKLWWPRPYGEQPLYTLEIELLQNGKCVDYLRHDFGIRTVRIGKPFSFYINGRKLFIRGANWVPIDTIFTCIEDEQYQKLLKYAVEGNISMLRVWGGGIYESDLFFRLCEKYGILVSQDFMMACGIYPQDETFCKQIEEEADHILRKYRNYTALACWAGDNENDQAFTWTGRQKEFVAYRINKEVLKKCCDKLDPHRFYAESSPFSPYRDEPGGDNPNSDLQGDTHLYKCGLDKDLPDYYKKIYEYEPKFMSEFGFISLPDKQSYYRYNFRRRQLLYQYGTNVLHIDFQKIAEQWELDGADEMQIHERFIGFMGLYHSLALQYWIEYMRSLKGICSGMLYWKFNDPTADNNDAETIFPSVMSSMDLYGIPKMTYYYTKRAYQDTIVFLRDMPENAVWYANEGQTAIKGGLIAEIKDFAGKSICRQTKEVTIQADASGMLMELDAEWEKVKNHEADPYSHYVRIKFIPESEGSILENIYYLIDIPDLIKLKLLPAELQMSVEETDGNRLTVKVCASRFVPNLRIGIWDGSAEFSDNDFPLNAEEEKEVSVTICEGSSQHITLFLEACNADRVIWKR